MGVLAEKYQPGDVERAARELWAARGWPRPDGIVGRSTAPIVRQFEGALITGDDPGLVAFRAVAADVDARYLALAGRRALGTLRRDGDPDEPALSLLRGLSVWTGGAAGVPVDSSERRAGVEIILGRMAALGLVATRDTSLRLCPSCAQARTPERIIYQQEEGDAYLVRFPIPEGDGVVHALVWVDAPWRLLGASALLVSPTLPYVVARYRRRGVDERILTSRPSLARLLEWLPGGEVEVLEEGTGARWQGRTYQYPLRHEFPMGGELTPPSGTVLAVPDVTDSGTGIVPLVPGHGGTDAQIADRHGIAGWPLVTTRGQLDFNLAHKYSGLDIPTANEFVARDLGESGALFARLRVRRGVPHCATCGTTLVWAPGRAWCLEPSRLPPERRDLYRRLLPKDPPVGQVEVAAWPLSELQTTSPGPTAVTLLECSRCERLAPLAAGPNCPCGNLRNPVSRRLLPSILGVLGAWARFDPFPAGDSAWLYLNERRRAPALVHHLAAMSGVPGVPTDVGLTLLPGVPEGGMAELVSSVGADAVRAALVRGERRERSGSTFPDRCRQEARRLARWWNLARETLERCDPSLLAAFAQPIGGSLGELEAEDRSILARWERVRLAALADYDHQAAGSAQRRLAAFLTNDLETYVARVRPRLERSGATPTRRAALRTLHHLLRGSAVVLAPVSPHIAEAVYSAVAPGRTSLFEATIDPLDAALLDEEAIKAWDRWGAIEQAVERFRRRVGLALGTPIPSLTAVVASDELAVSLRNDRPTVQRLARVTRFESFGPSTPWTGRQRSLEPVVSEIQRVYPQEAGQIVHLLRRLPARRRGDGGAPEELSVVVRGLPRKILPTMVQYAETLPERIIPLPWALGELYAELPAQQPVPTCNPPPVSPDAFQLISRVERELRRTAPPTGGKTGPVLIAVLDPLAAELQVSSPALEKYLGVPEVRVVDPSVEFPKANCLFGRTRTGVHWWVRISGATPRPAREKHPVARARLSRVRARRPGMPTAVGEVDFASEEEIAKEEQIRSLVQELDGVLGAPLLGPAKIAGAWAAGFHSVEDFSHAPFERVEQLRGFGGPIAETLVRKLGGTVPPRSYRAHRLDPVLGESEATPVPVPPDRALYAEAAGPDGGQAANLLPPTSDGARVPAAPTFRPGLRPATDIGLAVRSETRAQPSVPRPAPLEVMAPTVLNAPLTVAPSLSPQLPAPAAPEPPPSESEPEPGEEVASADGEPVPPAESTPLPLPVDDVPGSAMPPATVSPEAEATGGVLPEGGAGAPAPEVPEVEPEVSPAPTPYVSIAFESPAPEPDSEDLVVEEPGAPLEEPPLPEPAAAPDAAEPLPEQVAAPTEDLVAPETPLGDAPGPSVPPTPSSDAPAASESAPEPVLDESSPSDTGTTVFEGPESSGPRVDAENATTKPSAVPASDAAEATAPDVASEAASPPELAPTIASEPESPPTLPEPTDVTETSVAAGSSSEPVAEVALVPPRVPEPPPSPEPPLEAAPGPLTTEVEVPLESPPTEVVQVAPPEMAPVPPIPEPPVAPLPPPTPSGGITLIVATSYPPSFSGFLDATAAGHRGICVVRESPDRLRTHIGPRPVEIYWLTNIGRGLTLRPNDLDAYAAFLQKAVEQDRVTAFFLEGIEYLTRMHGTERVIERLAAFQVLAQAHNARVWVYLHPDLLPAADLEQFTAAFGSAPPTD